jgi:hypothetical protein
VVIGYALTIALGVLLPVGAVILYFALAIVLVVPFRTVAQVLAGNYTVDDPDPPTPPDPSDVP